MRRSDHGEPPTPPGEGAHPSMRDLLAACAAARAISSPPPQGPSPSREEGGGGGGRPADPARSY
jgi:hypothetical protein